jgi:hypothetical protein
MRLTLYRLAPARRIVMAVIVVVVAAAWWLATRPASAIGSPVGATVDGYQVGQRASCYESGAYFPCDEIVRLGLDALDRRLGGHPAIVETGVYDWNVLHSETIDIVVFDLADGTRYGERILCSVGGCAHM